MAVRLRPQSSAWLAPTALAAQLTAQTGQIAGQGVAGLLGGIAQGVGAFTQKREQRRVEAINESRYQDSLRMRQADDARQDRSFQYGAVRDQMALNNEFKTGAELAFALDPTPENKMKVDQAASNNRALSAALAKYGGVQMPEMPQAQRGVPAPGAQGAVAPTAGTEPTEAGSYNGEDVRRLATSMKDMSDEELSFVSEQYAQEALTRKATLDSAGKPGAGPSRTRTEYNEYSILARLAKGEQDRRSAKAKPAELEAEGAARKRGELSVTAPAEAAELERVNASNRARGLPEVGSLRQIGPVETTARAEAARAFTTLRDEKKAAILSAYRDKTLGLKREAMDLVKAKFELEKAGDSNAALKADARLSKVWSDVADYADAVVSQYEFVTGSESLPEVLEARKLQAEAGREILALARKAQSAPKAAPAASVGYPSWLPPEEKAAWDAMPDSEKQRAIELGGR